MSAIFPKTRIRANPSQGFHAGTALNFYCGVLGFELTQRFGNSAAFISAGGYHHQIGLNTWESAGASPPPAGTTGSIDSNGNLKMFTRPLDVRALLKEAHAAKAEQERAQPESTGPKDP